jgi:hypothetical protein
VIIAKIIMELSKKITGRNKCPVGYSKNIFVFCFIYQIYYVKMFSGFVSRVERRYNTDIYRIKPLLGERRKQFA